MKKFLTVLLALSVVFTYSFSAVGSVFAANPLSEAEYDQLVEQAAVQVESTTRNAYENAVKSLEDHNAGAITGIDAKYWKANASTYEAKISEMIQKKTDDIKKIYDLNKTLAEGATFDKVVGYFAAAGSYDGTAATEPAIPATVADVKAAIYADTDVQLATAKAYAQGEADDAIAALKSIDLSIYSEALNETTNMSSVAMADALVQKAITAIGKLSFDSKTDISEVKAELDKKGAFGAATLSAIDGTISNEAAAVTGLLTDFLCAKDATYNVEKYVIKSDAKYEGESLVTKDGEKDDADKLAVMKESYLAQVASHAATYLTTNKGDAAKAEAAAYKEGVSEIINATKTTAELINIFSTVGAIPAPSGYYTADKELIDELVVFANKYIAEGYDAEEINDIVADAKVAAYKVDTLWGTTALETAKNQIRLAVAKQFDTTQIEKAVAGLELALEAKMEDETKAGYYALEAEKVTDLYNTIIAEVKACVSQKDFDKVVAKYTIGSGYANPKGLSDIANRGDVQTAIKKTLTGEKGWTNNSNIVQSYGNHLNTGKIEAEKRDFVSAGIFTSATTMSGNWLADFYAEKGARTTDEAYNLIPEAKAALEAIPTKGVVAASVAAIEAQIEALPEAKNITANDAAAVEAVFDAYTKLNKETGATLSATAKDTLDKAVKAAGNAVRLDLLKAINAYKNVSVTAADKAALESLLEKVDTYNDKADANEFYATSGKITAEVITVKTKLGDIRTAAKKAVDKAIDALPVTVTKDNYNLVDTAKKLYDEYVATYTDFYNAVADVYDPAGSFNQNAANDFEPTDKKELNDAVKAADKIKAEIEAAEKAAKISATESLKISVSTKLYTKSNKIRVNWKVKDGDASYITGYQVYKSTKAQSGYKFMGKTTKSYMDNKKNLKKGQRYYYKVRAYIDVDGERYYSDWSNKGNRIYK